MISAVVFLVAGSMCASLSAAEFAVRSAYQAGVSGRYSEASSLVALSDGDVVLGAHTGGAIGSGNTNRGANDWLLQRLSFSSNPAVPQLRWTTMLGSGSGDYLNSLAADSSDSVYAAGECYAAFDGNAHLGGWDICLAKLDRSGNKVCI